MASRWMRRAAAAALSTVVAFAVLPVLGAQAHPGHGHVLIFTKTTQFRHTEAIDQGVPVLQTALEAEGIESTHSEDSGLFTDENLAQYDAIMMFQTSGDPWNADQKAALQRYVEAGGGIVAVHNATDMRGEWDWWDNLVGAKMPGHAATGTSPGQPGTVRLEDTVHPSTEHLGQRWERADEWYNYDTNVRGAAHVLATMDESTYVPGGNAQGYDHPISWCRPVSGGKTWVTGMGHFGSHYTAEPDFVQHIVGGTKYAAGLEPGDCGGTVWDNYEKVGLDQNTSAPFAMDVADDGKVFYTELVRGEIRVYDPVTQATDTAATIPVYSGGEDGLLGIALSPDFSETGHLFVYYAPASSNDSDPANFFSQVSRFTYENGQIDLATEEVLLEVPARRLPDEPGHTGGGLGFDGEGNLYLGVGDDVNPHSEPSGGYSPLSARNGTFHDARETSANTNDLRGKLLRIHPEADGSYTIPEGNMFPESEDVDDKTLPEIYAMGFRNPFRFSIDPVTGWIGLADYSPDNSTDAPATRGPAGIAEYNVIKEPGNYGWPLCMGGNEPFRDVDYGTSSATAPVVGDYFDCANPVNDSPRNTGLTDLPPAIGADMFYGYRRTSDPAIAQGGGLAPMGGPFYDYDEALESDTKFPEYYDGKPFFYDWARNKMFSVDLSAGESAGGEGVEKVNPFLPQEQFLAPIDSKFGPDGSLYVLDWGGGYGRDNPNSGLSRIDYISGSRSPIADIATSATSGPAPLTVEFDGSGSSDPEGEDLTYAWDFDGDGTTDSTDVAPSFEYVDEGVYSARLTVTDPSDKDGTTTVPITVGNTEPTVEFALPPNGSFFDFGDDLTWDVSVTDPEDGEIAGEDVIIQPALGHDDHAHPQSPLSGLTGTTPTTLGGHAPDENIFFAIDARYTDQGGADGANPLTGSQTTLVLPKIKQAEFFDAKSETLTVGPSRDIAGGDRVVAGQDGAWAMYSPVNLYRIDQLTVRASSQNGGPVELRQGAVDGPLLGTAEVPATGSNRYADVTLDVTDPGETFDLYVVMPGAGERRVNFIEAVGQGASPQSRPTVAITAPEEGVALEPGTAIEITADAADTDNEVTQVEFFAGDESLGVDTEAPYSVTWNPTEEKVHELTAVATNDLGLTTTSRVVGAQVGELFGALVPFTNAGGEFEKVRHGVFRITGAGADTWQGTDQYSSLYLPGATDDDSWETTVKVNSQTNTNGGAKAGLMVKNDIAAPGTSPGYAILGVRPSGGVEFLHDANGDGDIESSSAAGPSTYPMWLKMRRLGDAYTAYYSLNGTTWNQVGTAATLTGAATVQDVGMLNVSHATAASTVEYEGFAYTSEVVPEEPENPSEPLTCFGPLSDEFTGGALAPKWSTRTADGSAITVADGSLGLPVTRGDINEAVPGPISFVGQDTPTGAFEMSTKLTLDHASHWQYSGLMVHQSDDEYNKLVFVRHQNGGRFLEFQTETAGRRTTHASFTVPTTFPTTVYLRMVSNGTQLTASYSTDGETWTSLAGTAPQKSDAQIGLVAAGDEGATARTASVDWFRVTPDREVPTFTADDEFEGDALDGCRWARSVRYNSNNLTVEDGELKVVTQPGDINNANPLKPENFVLQDAPEGDWSATTRLRATMKQRYQYAGLLAYGDDDDYIKADVVSYNPIGAALDLKAEAVSEVDGAFGAGGNRQVEIPETSESGWWYVRLTKTGTSYLAEVSDGGVNWTPIGAPVTHPGELDSIGLVAVGPEQAEEVEISFDYFHLETGDTEPGDTEAPTTTLTMVPAAPDGDDGWYTTAPSFTLAADDGEGSGVATTEYRLGEGSWTSYDGAVVVDAEGETEVFFRSTDVDGNVEEAGSALVKLDTVAPVTTAVMDADGEDVTVTLTATDATSGLAGTEIKVDDGAWVAYTDPVTVTGAGDHTVSYRSTDVAGILEAEQTEDVVVEPGDTTGPELSVGGITAGSAHGHGTRPRLTWTATPTGSPVASVTATAGDVTLAQGPVDLSELSVGRHLLVVTATDEAGNTTQETVVFRVTTSVLDVRKLVNRFHGQGLIATDHRKDMILAFNRVEKLLDQRKRGQAVKELRSVRRSLTVIVDTPTRSVLREDLSLLIQRYS